MILDDTIFPVAPKKIVTSYQNNNKVINLANGGDVNILKKAGLTAIEFELLLPHTKYPFAFYESSFQNAEFYLNVLEELKNKESSFNFTIIRYLGKDRKLHNTSLRVSLENFVIVEDAGDNSDVVVRVKLKEFVEFSVKACNIVIVDTVDSVYGASEPVQGERLQENSPAPKSDLSYTVVSGDCLWNIAKKFYGDGGKYTIIFNANLDKISNPDLIFPGQVLVIPQI